LFIVFDLTLVMSRTAYAFNAVCYYKVIWVGARGDHFVSRLNECGSSCWIYLPWCSLGGLSARSFKCASRNVWYEYNEKKKMQKLSTTFYHFGLGAEISRNFLGDLVRWLRCGPEP
jgi:hypothetical protein